MQWAITRDHVCTRAADDPSAVGVGNFKGDRHALPFAFRLYDDDGHLYYEGRSDDRDSEAAFEPLDWAERYAGCTEIRYQYGNTWETL